MKKISLLSFILVVVLVMSSFSITVFADDTVKVAVDDKALNLDTPPQIVDGRTMVPLRGILEALGLTLSYDEKTKVITATNKDYTIILPVGSNTAIVNGKAVTLDVPASVTNGRTMVPARFISESAGADVKWEPSSKTVNISSADYSKKVNNTNNLSNINNSTVSVTNNNVDNSVNNSNNTVNNYNYSTNITNNITNNYSVNGLTEDLLKQILAKLVGTQYVTEKPQSANTSIETQANIPVNTSDLSINMSDAPVIIPVDKQPSPIWKDGILTYDEIVGNSCSLAFILPKGLGTGEADKSTGINKGYNKVVQVSEAKADGSRLAKGPIPITSLELQKGVAIIPLSTDLFHDLIDGESYKLSTYIEKDGQVISKDSEAITFTYKDNPKNHYPMNKLRITSIAYPTESDRQLFSEQVEQLDFLFSVTKPKSDNRAIQFAWSVISIRTTLDFVLRADGQPDIACVSNRWPFGKGDAAWYCITINEPQKLVKGTKYKLVPVNQTPGYEWEVDPGVYYTAP